MCNKTDNSCRQEKLGCKGCFHNNVNEYLNAKRYLLSRFNVLYSDERIKKSVFILLHWIDYQDELIKNDLMFKSKIREKIEHYEFLQDDELIKFPNIFTDKYFVYSEVVKVLKELLESEETK